MVAINTILREAKKNNTIYYFVTKERLNELSLTGHHQGVIAKCAEGTYGTLDDIFAKAEERASYHSYDQHEIEYSIT